MADQERRRRIADDILCGHQSLPGDGGHILGSLERSLGVTPSSFSGNSLMPTFLCSLYWLFVKNVYFEDAILFHSALLFTRSRSYTKRCTTYLFWTLSFGALLF